MRKRIKCLIYCCIIISVFLVLSIYKIKDYYNDIEYIKENIEIALNYAYDNNIMSENDINQISDIVDTQVLVWLNPRYWSGNEDSFNKNNVVEDFEITNIKLSKYDVFKSKVEFRVNYIYQQHDKTTNELLHYVNTNGNTLIVVSKKDSNWYISDFEPF